MAAAPPSYISLPHTPHSAIICGQTGCGKTVFVLDLLEGPYRGVFRHVVILCPTIRHNVTYQGRSWVWRDPEVYIVDPGERLHEWLRFWYRRFAGESTLYIIDDCAATKALTKKKDMLSELAFSGRTPSSLFGCCRRNIIRCSKTCESRPSGGRCSIAKTPTASRRHSERTT